MAIWTLLETFPAPVGGVFDMPSMSLGSYRALEFVLSGVKVTTDGTRLRLNGYVGGAEITTGYRISLDVNRQSAGAGDSVGATGQTGAFFMPTTTAWAVGNATGESFGGNITIDEPLGTSRYKLFRIKNAFVAETNSLAAVGGDFILENTGALQGVKIQGSSAFTAGQCRAYGLA